MCKIHPHADHVSSLEESTVPQFLSLIAFKDVLEFSYLLNNFVWQTYGWPWLELSASGKLGKLPFDACQCFAQIVYGKHHQLRAIELQGHTLYGTTVQNLSQALQDVASLATEDLVVPILLMLMYAVRI